MRTRAVKCPRRGATATARVTVRRPTARPIADRQPTARTPRKRPPNRHRPSPPVQPRRRDRKPRAAIGRRGRRRRRHRRRDRRRRRRNRIVQLHLARVARARIPGRIDQIHRQGPAPWPRKAPIEPPSSPAPGNGTTRAGPTIGRAQHPSGLLDRSDLPTRIPPRGGEPRIRRIPGRDRQPLRSGRSPVVDRDRPGHRPGLVVRGVDGANLDLPNTIGNLSSVQRHALRVRRARARSHPSPVAHTIPREHRLAIDNGLQSLDPRTVRGDDRRTLHAAVVTRLGHQTGQTGLRPRARRCRQS